MQTSIVGHSIFAHPKRPPWTALHPSHHHITQAQQHVLVAKPLPKLHVTENPSLMHVLKAGHLQHALGKALSQHTYTTVIFPVLTGPTNLLSRMPSWIL
jgi:hypothetical protein